jgi:hypothetical protein
MVRADRIALAAGGPLARAALGLIGLSIIFGWNTPPPQPAATASSQPGDSEQTAMTVTLRVPEGAPVKHLTVLDASGRTLAILTHWITGATTVESRRSGGVGVCYHMNTDGSAKMRMDGTAQVTLIDAEQDGTSQVSQRDVPPIVDPGAVMNTETPTGAGPDSGSVCLGPFLPPIWTGCRP